MGILAVGEVEELAPEEQNHELVQGTGAIEKAPCILHTASSQSAQATGIIGQIRKGSWMRNGHCQNKLVHWQQRADDAVFCRYHFS